MSEQEMNNEKSGLTAGDAPVSDKELQRRDLTPQESTPQPVFDVGESDLVVQPVATQPLDPMAFTDADARTVVQPEVTAGRSVGVENMIDEEMATPTERMAQNARTGATVAAEAFRRGEFMRDASVDAAADGDDRLIALLSYATQILIPFVMPALVLMSESSKKRPFQRFHAVQSIALMTALIVVAIFVGVGTAIVSIVPVVGWLVAIAVGCLSPIAVLMAWGALAYYGYQGYQGKRFAIPGLTSFLKDQGWI